MGTGASSMVPRGGPVTFRGAAPPFLELEPRALSQYDVLPKTSERGGISAQPGDGHDDFRAATAQRPWRSGI